MPELMNPALDWITGTRINDEIRNQVRPGDERNQQVQEGTSQPSAPRNQTDLVTTNLDYSLVDSPMRGGLELKDSLHGGRGG